MITPPCACPLITRRPGRYPSVRDFLVALIEWRKEQGEGIGPIQITAWMNEILRDEFGGKNVKAIMDTEIHVVPGDSYSVSRGILITKLPKQ